MSKKVKYHIDEINQIIESHIEIDKKEQPSSEILVTDKLAQIRYFLPPEKLNGIARTVVAYNNNGFRNFKIATLTLENGIVTHIDYSDPYASFEAMSRLELWNDQSVINLNNNWEHGKVLIK